MTFVFDLSSEYDQTHLLLHICSYSRHVIVHESPGFSLLVLLFCVPMSESVPKRIKRDSRLLFLITVAGPLSLCGTSIDLLHDSLLWQDLGETDI